MTCFLHNIIVLFIQHPLIFTTITNIFYNIPNTQRMHLFTFCNDRPTQYLPNIFYRTPNNAPKKATTTKYFIYFYALKNQFET